MFGDNYGDKAKIKSTGNQIMLQELDKLYKWTKWGAFKESREIMETKTKEHPASLKEGTQLLQTVAKLVVGSNNPRSSDISFSIQVFVRHLLV